LRIGFINFISVKRGWTSPAIICLFERLHFESKRLLNDIGIGSPTKRM
jgi:hypothetical protein